MAARRAGGGIQAASSTRMACCAFHALFDSCEIGGAGEGSWRAHERSRGACLTVVTRLARVAARRFRAVLVGSRTTSAA
eukprot:3087916-Rhodomonas_salina.2